MDFFDVCEKGDMDHITSFCARQGYVNWDYGLRGACFGGHLDIVNLAILNGATELSSGLRNACYNGHFEIARFLISKGANNLNLALYDACYSGNIKLVKLMISKIKGNTKDGSRDKRSNDQEDRVSQVTYDCDFNPGLLNACSGGHIDIVHLMISKGANDWNQGFYQAYNSLSDNGIKIIHLMISKGANVVSYFYNWSFNKPQISQLLYLGTPLVAFARLDDYQDLERVVSNTRMSIIKSSALIPDLLSIISKCIVV